MRFILMVSICLTAAYAGLLQADTGIDGVTTKLQPDDFSVTQNGRTLYQAQCAACHGAELQGQPDWQKPDASGRLPAPPHNKTGHTWHHSDDLLFEITKYGPAAAAEMPTYQSNMPAYENILSDDEMIAVLSYIKSTWPQQEREWQDNLNVPKPDADEVFDNSIKAFLNKLDTKPETTGSKHDDMLKAAPKADEN